MALNCRRGRRLSRQLLGGFCCNTSMCLLMGFGLEILLWPIFRSPDEGTAGATRRRHLLTNQLRRTGRRCDWRWTAEELDETPQVLRGSSEQHLVLYSAQAA
jgi:hypothetical protein